LEVGKVDTELNGLGVLVTGGAGGIGCAIVRAFAAEGARVASHYRSRYREAEALASETGGVALRADLTIEEEADALVPTAARALGGLDILVANAGTWPGASKPLWEMSYERWRHTIETNLDITFLSVRAFLRHLRTARRGNIVLVGSTAAHFGQGGYADYASAKSAVTFGLLKSLKNEIVRIAPFARVNAVAPGWTRTSMTRDFLHDANFESRATRTMPIRRLATPQDVASVVLILASNSVSGHVTGEVVLVAGGMEGRVLHD
jgi:3-oxoacyl-[acyl-carrier protein] reductase